MSGANYEQFPVEGKQNNNGNYNNDNIYAQQPAQYAQGGVPQQNIYGQPAQPAYPLAHSFQRDIFGCFSEVDSCLEGYCCSYCQASAQYNKLEHGEADVHWLACLAAFGLDHCCGWGGVALCVLNFMNRQKIRQRFNIEPKGQEIEDLLLSCCCRCCAVTQQYHEMKLRGAWPGGIIVKPPVMGPMGTEAPIQGTPLINKNV